MREYEYVELRLPCDLIERVEAAAQTKGCLIDYEVAAVLEEKYPNPKEPESLLSMEERVQALERAAGIRQ